MYYEEETFKSKFKLQHTTAVTIIHHLRRILNHTKNFLGFFKVFLLDTFTCPILGPLVPLFWISGDVSSGFQSQSYQHCRGKCNVHFLRSTSGATHCQPLDRQHCWALTGFISCPRILLCGTSESQPRNQQIMSAAS